MGYTSGQSPRGASLALSAGVLALLGGLILGQPAHCDSWDPGDDLGTGGTSILPTTTPQSHGPHTLDAADTSDWFTIPMTAGYSYSLSTIGGTGNDYGYLWGKSNASQLQVSDDDSGGSGQFAMLFTAAKSQSYYLQVTGNPSGAAWSGNLFYFIAPTISGILSVDTSVTVTGNWVGLAFTVTNTGPATVTGILPSIAAMTGTWLVESISGPTPTGPVTLGAGVSQTFRWTYSVSGAGMATFMALATGTDSGLAQSVNAVGTRTVTGLAPAAFAASTSASPPNPSVGQWVQAVLTVTNTGGVAATGVLPFLQVNTGGGLVTYESGPTPAGPVTVAAGASQSFTWTYSVSGGGQVEMTLTASGVDAARGKPVVSAGTVVMSAAALLRARLSTSPSSGVTRQWVQVVLSVTNAGGESANGVLPSIRACGASPPGQFVLGPVPPGPVTLGPGASQQFTWTWSVSGVGTVVFSATGAGTDAGTGQPVSASGAAQITAVIGAELTLIPSWLGDGPVILGGVIDLMTQAKNTGAATANGVFWWLEINSGSGCVSYVSGPTPSTPRNIVPNDYYYPTWRYSGISPGWVTWTLTVAGTDSVSGGTLTTSVTRRFNVTALKAALSIVPSMTAYGQPVEIVLTVTNTGAGAATGVFPSNGLAFTPGVLGLTGGPVPSSPQPLAAGASVSFTWTASVTGGGNVLVTATATGTDMGNGAEEIARDSKWFEGFDAWEPADNTAATGTILSPTLAPQSHGQHLLDIWEGDPEDWYRIDMTAGYTYHFDTAGWANPTGGYLYENGGGTFVTGNYMGGPGGAFTLTYRAAGTKTYFLEVIPAGSWWQGNLNYWIQSPVNVSLAAVPSPVDSGTCTQVVLTVTNAGGATISGILPALEVVAGQSLVQYVSGPAPAGPVTLTVGQAQSFTWTYSASGSGRATFSGTATGTDALFGTVAASGTVTADVTGLRASLAVTANPDMYPGPVAVVMTVTNTGVDTVEGLVPLLGISTGGAIVAATGGPTPAGLAALAPGESGSFTWTYNVTQGGMVWFTATVTGADVDAGLQVGSRAASTLLVTDAWDPADNSGAGGTLLTPGFEGSRHGPHVIWEGDKIDWYRIPMVAGITYYLNTTGGSGDDIGELYSDAGGSVMVASDDDSGSKAQFAIAYNPTVTQDYYLKVYNYWDWDDWEGYLNNTRSALVVSVATEPNPAVTGQWVNVVVTGTNTGTSRMNPVGATLGVTSGAGLVSIISGPVPGPVPIPAGGSQSFTWTVSISGSGTVGFTGDVAGTYTATGFGMMSRGTGSLTTMTRAQLLTAVDFLPAAGTVGQPFQVAVTVSNTGQSAATGVTATVFAGPGAGIASWAGGPSPAGPLTILPGSATTFLWTFTATGSGVVTFTATATGFDAISGAASSSSAVRQIGVSSLNASASVTAPPIVVGNWITVALSVTNTGAATVSNVLPGIQVRWGGTIVSPVGGPSPPGPANLTPGTGATFVWTFSAGGAGMVSFSLTATGVDGVSGPVWVSVPVATGIGNLTDCPRAWDLISTVAGTGVAGYNGDGIPATSAQLNDPFGVTGDAAGNVYVADFRNSRVRKIPFPSGVIATVAGGGGTNADGIPATSAALDAPQSVAVDSAGNLYISDRWNHRVRKVDAVTGLISTVAGTQVASYNGDGIPATTAQLNYPYGVNVDAAGNVYIADSSNHRVRKVSAATGLISTVAGNGNSGFNADGIPAISANINPVGVAVDGAGNLFIADDSNYRVRRVDAITGLISTVAGTGVPGYNGEGIPATAAQLRWPTSVAVDGAGNLYIVDYNSSMIRRVDATTGLISTVVGTGTAGFNGDGIPATLANLYHPYEVFVDPNCRLLIADQGDQRVRRVVPVALSSSLSWSATPLSVGRWVQVELTVSNVGGVDVTGLYPVIQATLGTTLFAVVGGPSPATVPVLAGGSATTFVWTWSISGVGAIAVTATAYGTDSVTGLLTWARTRSGCVTVPGARIQPAVVSVPVGAWTGHWFTASITVSNTGGMDAAGVTAQLGISSGGSLVSLEAGPIPPGPLAIPPGTTTTFVWTFSASGTGVVSLSITVTGTDAVSGGGLSCVAHRAVVVRTPASCPGPWGTIETIAGTGTGGYNGTGIPATTAQLYSPAAVVTDGVGRPLIADMYNDLIRMVDPSTGLISKVAGGGAPFYGDGGLAVNARLADPAGIALDAAGNIYLSDNARSCVRRIDAVTGIITHFAGWSSGSAGYDGDFKPATGAKLNYPNGLATDSAGNVYIADAANHRIRRVEIATGLIRTVAGTGAAGFNADGISATVAQVSSPRAVAIDLNDNLYIADAGNHRIRLVDMTTGIISTVAGTGTSGSGGDGTAATGAQLSSPCGVFVDGAGNILVADSGNNRVRRVDAASGLIDNVAGTGAPAYGGDYGMATSAALNSPNCVALDDKCRILIADMYNHRVRRVGLLGLVAGLTASSGTAWVGQSITLVLTVTNAGSAPVNGVAPGLTPTTGGGLVSWLTGPAPAGPVDLASGESQSFTWTWSVTGSGALVFTASATGANGGTGDRSSAGAILGLPAQIPAGLKASLAATPGRPLPGQWFRIALTVTNTGTVPVAGVIPSLDINSGGGLVSQQLGPMPPGPLTIVGGGATTFAWTFTASGLGRVEFTATAGGTDAVLGGAVLSNGATLGMDMSTIRASLAAVPAIVAPGQSFQLRLSVTNGGSSTVTGVSVAVSFPGGPGTAAVTGGPNPPDLSMLRPGTSTTFTWVCTATGPGPIRASATATGTDVQSAITVVAAAAVSATVMPPAALVSSMAITPSNGCAGQWITVAMTVTNTGGAAVKWGDTGLGIGWPSTILIHKTGPTPAYPVSIAGGASVTIVWSYSVGGAGAAPFTGTFSATDAVFGGGLSTSASANGSYGSSAQLSASASVSPATVSAGQWVSVVLDVSNTGDSPATGVMPSIAVGPGAGIVTLESGPSPAGPVTVPGGGSAAFTWTWSVAGTGTVAFTVTATGTDSCSGGARRDAATAALTAQAPAALVGGLTASPSSVRQGERITVVLAVTNTGGAAVSGLSASPGASPQPSGGAFAVSGPTPAGPLGLAGGGAAFLTWVYEAAATGPVAFSATASGLDANSGRSLLAAGASTAVAVTQSAVLRSTLAFARDGVFRGQTVAVTMTVSNTGDTAASGVTATLSPKVASEAEVIGQGAVIAVGTIPAGEARTVSWTVRVKGTGPIVLRASTDGVDALDAAQVSAGSEGTVTAKERFAEDIVLYPNPVSRDSFTVGLHLRSAASEVEIEVFNVVLERVWRGTWRGVPDWDDQFVVEGANRWAPGPYLVRALATLADGSTVKYPVARMVVKR